MRSPRGQWGAGDRWRTGRDPGPSGAACGETQERFWTNCHPNRPLMHRCPLVTSWSIGDMTRTMLLSCTCSSSVQPTPQYGQMVSVTVCFDSSHVPSWRMSYSDLNMSAPVGHTPMQLPQYTQADSGSGVSNSVAIPAPKPRPATAI